MRISKSHLNKIYSATRKKYQVEVIEVSEKYLNRVCKQSNISFNGRIFGMYENRDGRYKIYLNRLSCNSEKLRTLYHELAHHIDEIEIRTPNTTSAEIHAILGTLDRLLKDNRLDLLSVEMIENICLIDSLGYVNDYYTKAIVSVIHHPLWDKCWKKVNIDLFLSNNEDVRLVYSKKKQLKSIRCPKKYPVIGDLIWKNL